jgi:hypothetical protein
MPQKQTTPLGIGRTDDQVHESRHVRRIDNGFVETKTIHNSDGFHQTERFTPHHPNHDKEGKHGAVNSKGLKGAVEHLHKDNHARTD